MAKLCCQVGYSTAAQRGNPASWQPFFFPLPPFPPLFLTVRIRSHSGTFEWILLLVLLSSSVQQHLTQLRNFCIYKTFNFKLLPHFLNSNFPALSSCTSRAYKEKGMAALMILQISLFPDYSFFSSKNPIFCNKASDIQQLFSCLNAIASWSGFFFHHAADSYHHTCLAASSQPSTFSGKSQNTSSGLKTVPGGHCRRIRPQVPSPFSSHW